MKIEINVDEPAVAADRDLEQTIRDRIELFESANIAINKKQQEINTKIDLLKSLLSEAGIKK